MKVGKAGVADVPRIKELIDVHAKRDEMLARSLSEIYEHLRAFFVAREGRKVVGCCALYISWKDLAEVKSLAVDPKLKGKGIGKALVEAALAEAKDLKIPRVFTLTTKPTFFKKLKFKAVDKDELPMKIWGECVRCSKYAECDETALVYNLK